MKKVKLTGEALKASMLSKRMDNVEMQLHFLSTSLQNLKEDMEYLLRVLGRLEQEEEEQEY